MSLVKNDPAIPNPLFESVLNDNVEECELDISPSLYTWTEKRTVFGFDRTALDRVDSTVNSPTGQFSLRNAYDNLSASGVLVKVGDTRPGYGNAPPPASAAINPVLGVDTGAAIAVRMSLRTRSSQDTVNIDQVITYQQPGAKCEVAYDVYQQTEVRNFAEDETGWKAGPPGAFLGGKDTRVTAITWKVEGSGPNAGDTTNTAIPVVVDINVPCLMRSARVTQYEVLPGVQAGMLQGQQRPFWNSEEFNGYAAGTLLYLSRSLTSDGTDLYRVVYTFLINQYGWHHFYAVYKDANDFVPAYITPINPATVLPTDGTVSALIGNRKDCNGQAAFRMLPSFDFNKYLSRIKPPFNVPAAVCVAPPAGISSHDAVPGGSGNDFVPIPGGFA